MGNKCEICAETKLVKRRHSSTQRESELLSLVHTDLGDLKQTVFSSNNYNPYLTSNQLNPQIKTK